MPKFSIVDRAGTAQEIDIDLSDYRAAGEAGVTLSQHLASQYPADERYGTVMEQAMASAGMYVRPDQRSGLRPPTMAEVFNGSARMQVAAVRPDGSQRHDPAGRLLFPEIVLQAIQSELTTDHGDFLGAYNRMVATTATINSARFDQPVINTTAPAASENMPVAQGAEPPVMVNISVADRNYRVPNSAIGLTITDEAMQSSTLDLVNLAMTAQARQQRVRKVESQLNGMINGDVDVGETAIAGETAQSYDANITQAGEISQKAWVKFLRNDYRKRSIGALIMDLDTAFAIENRTNRPVITGDNPNSPRIDTIFTIENLGLPNPQVLLLDAPNIAANTIVGLDTRYAIRRVINVAATYSAIEDFVLRKMKAFRVDYGEMSHKFYPDAWAMLTLTV